MPPPPLVLDYVSCKHFLTSGGVTGILIRRPAKRLIGVPSFKI